MSKRRFSMDLASRPLRWRHQEEERVPTTPLTRPRPGSRLLQGKYVGRAFEDVAKEDRSYVEWAFREARSGELSSNLAAFVHYVKLEFGGLMTIGMHKGRYFKEIIQEDPEYADWCTTIGAPGDPLRAFADFAARMRARMKHDENNEDNVSKKCMFCLEKPLNSAWIPCGHMVACYECGRQMDKRCPICRQYGMLQKLFVG